VSEDQRDLFRLEASVEAFAHDKVNAAARCRLPCDGLAVGLERWQGWSAFRTRRKMAGGGGGSSPVEKLRGE